MLNTKNEYVTFIWVLPQGHDQLFTQFFIFVVYEVGFFIFKRSVRNGDSHESY